MTEQLKNLIYKKEHLLWAKKDLSLAPNTFTRKMKEIWDMEIAILEDEIKILKDWLDFSLATKNIYQDEFLGQVGVNLTNVRPSDVGNETSLGVRGTIIMLCGKSQHGKNTVANIIQEEFPSAKFQQISFAAKVKEVYTLLTGEGYIESQEFKAGECLLFQKSRRQVLIDIGMGLRDRVGPDVWAMSLLPSIDPSKNYIITDFRFPSELKVLQQAFTEFSYEDGTKEPSLMNIIPIRVVRDLKLPIHDNESETALNDKGFTTIWNNSTKEDLRRVVLGLLTTELTWLTNKL